MARTGRPRGFDRDQAVDQAMMLFWQHGYESTSLAQLKEGMGGISAPSFYAAFTSKEALFQEVIARYLATHGRANAGLYDASVAPRSAIEQTLRNSAKMQTDRSHPAGCLMVLSGATCSKESEQLQKMLAEDRTRNRKGFDNCVRRAIEAGELPASTHAAALATMFDAFLQGMSIQAREGTSLAKLNASITQVMSIWDCLAKPVLH